MKKINAVDIVVLLLIVICIVGIAVRFTTTNKSGFATIEYKLKIKDVREYSVNALEKKGNVYDSKLQKKIGEIVDVEISDAKETAQLVSGENVIVSVPEKYDIVLTIQTKGSANETAYFSEANTELCVGQEYSFCTKWIDCSGQMTQITVIE